MACGEGIWACLALNERNCFGLRFRVKGWVCYVIFFIVQRALSVASEQAAKRTSNKSLLHHDARTWRGVRAQSGSRTGEKTHQHKNLISEIPINPEPLIWCLKAQLVDPKS